MKTIKFFVAAAIVTAGISSAYAASYDLGLLPSSPTELNFGAGWQANPASVVPGSFTDTFTFRLENLLTLTPSANIIVPGGFDSLSVSAISSVVDGSFYNYSFSASGVATSQWGVYTVNFSGINAPVVPLTPVPEPETFAMLLAGLGVIATAVRRRRTKVVAVV